MSGLLASEGLQKPLLTFAEALLTGRLIYHADTDMLYLAGESAAYACCMAEKEWGMVISSPKVFILTRPLKLGSAASRKRLTSVALTGPLSLRPSKVAVVGSDDLRHWRLLGSACGTAVTAMRGTGARYISIAASTELKSGQTMSGCTFFY